MAPDPVVAVSAGGGTSEAFHRYLALSEIGIGLSVELD
jgi:hypothetical protein